MNGIKGDDTKLRRLAERLGRAASGQLLAELRRTYVAETQTQIGRSFAEGRSPTGEKWPALKKGARSPLVASGTLRNGFDVTASRDGVHVTNVEPHAQAHQRGFRIRRRQRGRSRKRRSAFGAGGGRVPARPMVPTSRWGPHAEQALRALASRIVRRFFRS